MEKNKIIAKIVRIFKNENNSMIFNVFVNCKKGSPNNKRQARERKCPSNFCVPLNPCFPFQGGP